MRVGVGSERDVFGTKACFPSRNAVVVVVVGPGGFVIMAGRPARRRV